MSNDNGCVLLLVSVEECKSLLIKAFFMHTTQLYVQLVAEIIDENQSQISTHSTRHLIGSHQRLLELVERIKLRHVRHFVSYISN